MLNGIKILVAEDNLINQKIANYVLLKQGADVLNATNGEQAIDMLINNKIDVILMDLQMPGKNGFEAAKYIRNVLKNNIPIIALTADLFAHQNHENDDSGINAFIVKPFDPVSLCELIQKLLKK